LTAQRRHVHLAEQVAQECSLRQDLGIHERRPRLKRYGRQLLGAVKLARRMDVDQRNREDHSARQAADPSHHRGPHPRRPPAHDVIANVDRFEQGLQVRGSPGLDGRCDQDEGKRSSAERGLDSFAEPRLGAIDSNGTDLDGTTR
jgi:hypothetical protein